MIVRLHFVLVLLLAAFGQAQIVDRMVAVVNKHVILESELDQAARVEFLLQGKPIEKLAQADRVAVLERLIDRSLLDQQSINLQAVFMGQCAQRVDDFGCLHGPVRYFDEYRNVNRACAAERNMMNFVPCFRGRSIP
jgi:hypothetical protein